MVSIIFYKFVYSFSSVAQSCLTLQPHGLQHARLPCPSPTPGLCSDPCPSRQWCHPTISSSVVPFLRYSYPNWLLPISLARMKAQCSSFPSLILLQTKNLKQCLCPIFVEKWISHLPNVGIYISLINQMPHLESFGFLLLFFFPSLSCVQLFASPWNPALQASLSSLSHADMFLMSIQI